MTAEILIMNKSAIAMAADSAVTIGNEKTYTGVNKLFMLSNNPPMGIMIYDNADFMDIPMETLIKEYRKKCEIKKYETVKQYMEEFLEFIKELFLSKNNFPNFFQTVVETIILKMPLELTQELEQDPQNVLKEIDEQMNDYQKMVFKDEIFKNSNEIIKDIIKKNLPSIDQKIKKTIEEIIQKLYIINTCHNTGVVIAGFNEQDMYPSYSSYSLHTIFKDKLFYKKVDEEENYPLSVIQPFAQTDVIDNFLMGVNRNILADLDTYVKTIVDFYPNLIQNIISETKNGKNN